MGATVNNLYTFVGVCAGLFGFRRLQEESAWRWWPATAGRVEEFPKRAYRGWQDYHVSLPLYVLYKYYIRDRPGIFLSVPYSYSVSEGARARGAAMLMAAPGPGSSAAPAADVPGSRMFATGELRVTRDVAELRPDEVRVAATSPEVTSAMETLPSGCEVVVHYNPAMPKHSVLRPPTAFRRFTDGEMEGLTVLNGALLLILVGRRQAITLVFRRAAR